MGFPTVAEPLQYQPLPGPAVNQAQQQPLAAPFQRRFATPSIGTVAGVPEPAPPRMPPKPSFAPRQLLTEEISPVRAGLDIAEIGGQIMEPVIQAFKAARFFPDALKGEVPQPGTREFDDWWEKKKGLFNINDRKFLEAIAPFTGRPADVYGLAQIVPENWTLNEKDLLGEVLFAIAAIPELGDRLAGLLGKGAKEALPTLRRGLEVSARHQEGFALPAGFKRLRLKNMPTKPLQREYDALKVMASERGLDLTAVEAISPDDYFLHLNKAHAKPTDVDFDKMSKWVGRLPEANRQAAADRIGLVHHGEQPDLYFRSVQDARAFLETGDTSRIATTIHMRGPSRPGLAVSEQERAYMDLANLKNELFALDRRGYRDAPGAPERIQELKQAIKQTEERIQEITAEYHRMQLQQVFRARKSVPPEATPKEPWQMTQSEYVMKQMRQDVLVKHAPRVPKGRTLGERRTAFELGEQRKSILKKRRQHWEAEHKEQVRLALQQGMPVPREVAGDYGLEPPLWQLTKAEYGADGTGAVAQHRAQVHRAAIERALVNGEVVPSQVLADYPDLARAARPTQEAALETTARPLPGAEPVKPPTVEVAEAPTRPAEVSGEPVVKPTGEPPPPVEPPRPPIEVEPPVPGELAPGVQATMAQARAIVERDKPGTLTRMLDMVPGLRQAQRWLHPSLGMNEDITAAWIGQGHATAEVMTRLEAETIPFLQRLDALFGKGAVSGENRIVARFIGSEAEKVPFSGTLYDVLQRPQLYDLSEAQRGLLDDIKALMSNNLNSIRDAYGIKIGEFKGNPEGVFLGNVDISDKALEMAGGARAAIARGGAKERFYPTGADRWFHDKSFQPVTDVGQLMRLRINGTLANMAGQEVFKVGSGGLTKLEVLQQTHPKLAERMMGLRTRLESLRGARERLSEKQLQSIDDFLRSDVDDVDLIELKDGLKPVISRGKRAGMGLEDINSQIRQVRAEITALQPAWRTANTSPYRMVTEGNLYRYYEARDANVIRTLEQKSQSAALRIFDDIRATAFGGDLSPATIQGLTAWFLDPMRASRSVAQIGGRELFSEASLAADVMANPESWARFTRATGLNPLSGAKASEFGVGYMARIPKLGKYWEQFNEGIYRPLKWSMKKAFDGIYDDGIRLGLSPEEAAAVAADDVTKWVPFYSQRRLGLSQAKAAKYRAALTSVSFLTQPAALLSDATKGILKMGLGMSTTPTEAYAVKRILTLAVTTETLAVASNVAYAELHGGDKEAAAIQSVDPNSGYFMSVVLPWNGNRIGIGGPFRSLIRGIWPREVQGVPFPLPLAGVGRFANSKLAPLPRVIRDEIRNEDYFGQKIRTAEFPLNVLQSLEYAVEGSIPLTAGTAADELRRGHTDDIVSQVVSQFAGVNLVPESQGRSMEVLALKSKDAVNFYRAKIGMKPWNGQWTDLWPFEKAQFEMSPQGREIRAKANFSSDYREKLKIAYDFYDAQVNRDKALESGSLPNGDPYTPNDWKDDYYRAIAQFTQARETFDEVSGIKYREPKTPEQKARAGYYDLMNKYLDKDTKTFDGDGWEIARRNYLKGLSPDLRLYVVLNTGVYDTPKVKEFKADREVMRAYWDIWDKYMQQPAPPPYHKIQDIVDEWVRVSNRHGPGDMRRAAILAANPYAARAKAMIDAERVRLRMSSQGADIEEKLVKWGYLSKYMNPINIRKQYAGAGR